MKRLKQHWMMGPLSWLLSAALTLPAWLAVGAMFLAAPHAAEAQALNRMPIWAVVNFTNTSGYGGDEIGVQASDGLVVELSKTNRFNIVAKADTEDAIAKSGVVQPLDTIGLQKLAEYINTNDDGCDAVATGDVAAISFTNNPRRATVSVVVKVVDRISGELINGAVAQGTSTPRPIPVSDDDALVDQAIGNATFNAVKQINSFNLPHATVLLHADQGTVTLNKGTEDGLYNGLNMVVTRYFTQDDASGNQISMLREVGRIKVTNASADESYAAVTDQGIGIHSEDVATAIYQLPPYFIGSGGQFHIGTVNNAETAAENNAGGGGGRPFLTGFGGALSALLVGLGLVALAKGGSSTSSAGGGRSGGVSASEIANSSVSPSADSNASDNTYFVPLEIQINPNAGQFQGDENALEYHIFRNPQPSVLYGSQFQGIAATNANISAIPIAVVPNLSSGPIYDGPMDVGPITETVPSATDDTTTVVGTFYDGTISTTTTAGEYPIVGTALNVGDQVSYTVQVLYTVPNFIVGTSPGGSPVGIGTTSGTTSTTTGTTTTTTTTEGALIYSLSEPVNSNTVTYLQPVIMREIQGASYPIADPTTETPFVDSYALSTAPTNVSVTVPSVYGGTATGLQYVLQISTDPSFNSNVQQYTTTASNTATSVNFRSGEPVEFPNLDLTKIAAFSGISTLYVRIGVRDLRNGSDTTANPYVFSTSDPNEGGADVLPPSLTPGNSAAATSSARAMAKIATSTAPITTQFIGHVRNSSAATPSVTITGVNATPSETPHGDISSHPGAGGLGNTVRPTSGH